MKKIFTLLLAMGSLTFVFAQSGRYGNNHGNYAQKNDFQGNHQNENSQYIHRDFNQGYGGYNENRGGYNSRNDRMMHQDRRFDNHNDRRNNYWSYARPNYNRWNERNFGRRDFRNREW